MRSSSGSSLFTSLSMLLILKIIKIFKKYYHPSWLCGSVCVYLRLHNFSQQFQNRLFFLYNFWSDLKFFATVSAFTVWWSNLFISICLTISFFICMLSYCHSGLCPQQDLSPSPQLLYFFFTRWAGYLLFSTSSLPSGSLLCHSDMVGIDRVSCPYISLNKWMVCLVVFFSFARS